MQDINNLCMHCMKDKGTELVCPHCHKGAEDDQGAPYLPVRTRLAERYIVGSIISKNGEGATYMGWDCKNDSAVLIREFLPLTLCERDLSTWELKPIADCTLLYNKYLGDFLTLSKRLARMRDLSSLMPIYDIFELGGTAYTVSEYCESITLNDFLIRNGGSLNYEQCRSLLMPVLTSLIALHNVGIEHDGLSPENLLVGKDGKIRVIDFCIPEARSARSELKEQLYAGYSAIEQYGYEGTIGPWTDVYGFASIIYRTLVGNAPTAAPERATNDRLVIPAKIAENVPKHSMVALANALQFLPNERTSSLERFKDEFSAAPNVVTTTDVENKKRVAEGGVVSVSEEKKKEETDRRKKAVIYTLIALGCTFVVIITVVLIILGSLGILGCGGDEGPSQVESSTVESSQTQSVVSEFNVNEIEVPNVVNQTVADVQKSLNNKFVVVVEAKQYSDQVEEGLIISQTPAANEKINSNGEVQVIKVVVSMGAEKVSFPSIEGLSYEKAMLKLYEAGFSFVCIEKEEKYDPDQKPGTVLSATHLNSEMISGNKYTRDTAILISVADAQSGPSESTESTEDPETEE
ncbi:MAG: PASTA domain-containing protein [Clostridia bacterium]|nr:PASTA domain-containing protein [Clostridia bacterium]